MSWDWDQGYLPEDIHSNSSEFYAALDLLREYEFVDRDQGTLVALGFGLLLHDCWKVVELEEGDEDCPKFLYESILDLEGAMRAVKAIKEVTNRLPPLDTAGERPKELELDGSAKRQKASAGRKKHVAKKGLTNIPPPVPSTSKQSGMEKDGNNPAENIRSKRQRKPSKKVRGFE